MMRNSAKHQSAPTAEKVQMSAAPYRGAPIRTCPALPLEITQSTTNHVASASECNTQQPHTVAYWHWRVQFPDRDPLEIYCSPDADHAEVMRQYPTATDLEPIPEPPRPVLSPSGKWYFTPPATQQKGTDE
jgi:hypothetical protein